MLTKIKTYALYMALGAAIIIGLNSLGYVINVNVWQPMPLLDMPELGKMK